MVISVLNLKGGTGKTTTAIALASAAAENSKAVRVLDADPQSSASAWAMDAEDAGEPLPFNVEPANLIAVKRTARTEKGKEDEWTFIDCPPSGNIMDEAAEAADMVVIPTTTGPADIAKAVETSKTLAAGGIEYAVLITMARKGTLSLKQTLDYLDEADESYFEARIPEREGLKNMFGHTFGAELYGYREVFKEIEEAVDGR